MILKHLSIQNFLSIKNIELDLSNRGLMLLQGRNLDNDSLNNNGAGKSSIIEALIYVLYGRTIRGLKGDTVVHKIPGKNMKICLELVDDNKDTYQIVRHRLHSVNKNKSLLFKNGKDITPLSESEFNDHIVNLVQADFLTFTSSVLYSAESFKFTSATDAEIKKTFDIMLGLDVYQQCWEVTKSRLRTVEYELSHIQAEIDNRNVKISVLGRQIQDTLQDKVKYDASIKAKEEDLNTQINTLYTKLGHKQEELIEFKKQLGCLQTQKTALEEQFKDKLEALKDADEVKVSLQDIQDDILNKEGSITFYEKSIAHDKECIEDHQKAIEQCNQKIEKLLKEKETLSQKPGQPCPTCGRPMTELGLKSAKKRYDELVQEQQEQIVVLQTRITQHTKAIITCQQGVELNRKALVELKEIFAEFQNQLPKVNSLIAERSTYQEKVSALQTQIVSTEASIRIETEDIKHTLNLMKKYQKDLLDLERNNPYDAILDKYQEELLQYQYQVKQLSVSQDTKKGEKDCLVFWQQAYSNQGIKSFILDDITPCLNRQVNKYLSKLTSGHIEVKFNTQSTLKSGELREKFSIEIFNKDGGSDYLSNSSGERKRIDLAVNLALQDLLASRSNKRMNVAIFDEAFDALDQVGIESVVNLLHDLAAEKSTIIVISHNEHLKAYFTNTLTVVKQNGFSMLDDSTGTIMNS